MRVRLFTPPEKEARVRVLRSHWSVGTACRRPTHPSSPLRMCYGQWRSSESSRLSSCTSRRMGDSFPSTNSCRGRTTTTTQPPQAALTSPWRVRWFDLDFSHYSCPPHPPFSVYSLPCEVGSRVRHRVTVYFDVCGLSVFIGLVIGFKGFWHSPTPP